MKEHLLSFISAFVLVASNLPSAFSKEIAKRNTFGSNYFNNYNYNGFNGAHPGYSSYSYNNGYNNGFSNDYFHSFNGYYGHDGNWCSYPEPEDYPSCADIDYSVPPCEGGPNCYCAPYDMPAGCIPTYCGPGLLDLYLDFPNYICICVGIPSWDLPTCVSFGGFFPGFSLFDLGFGIPGDSGFGGFSSPASGFGVPTNSFGSGIRSVGTKGHGTKGTSGLNGIGTKGHGIKGSNGLNGIGSKGLGASEINKEHAFGHDTMNVADVLRFQGIDSQKQNELGLNAAGLQALSSPQNSAMNVGVLDTLGQHDKTKGLGKDTKEKGGLLSGLGGLSEALGGLSG